MMGTGSSAVHESAREQQQSVDTRGIAFSLMHWLVVGGLVLPFVGQTIPYGFPLFFITVCAALGAMLLRRIWLLGWRRILLPVDGFSISFLIVSAVFLYGMLLTQRVHVALYSELANVLSILIIYAAAINFVGVNELRSCLRHTQSAIVVVCVGAAGFGVLKFALLLQGRRLGFVEAASPNGYPFGTSLIYDYNMFSLALLSGAVVAFGKILYTKSFVARLVLIGSFLVIVSAGLFAGSRRFWVMTPVAIVLMLILYGHRRGGVAVARRVALLLLVSLFGGWLIARFSGFDWGYVSGFAERLQGRIATLFDAEGGRGFEPRLMRWDYAYSLASGWQALIGQGFDYIYAYSCRFGGCVSVDYPHSPFLSALLYGGVFGVLSVATLFIYVILAAIRSLSASHELSFYGVILLIHLPFVLVSGNSVLSVKSFLICMVLCQLVNKAMDSSRNTSDDSHSR